MNRGRATGFTVIETMLFLAIASLLAMVILTTASLGINNQRYSDAVNSLLGFMQARYSDTVNVKNDRPTTIGCSSTGISAPGASPQSRGTSDCMIVGQLIRLSEGGSVLTSRRVYTLPYTDDAGREQPFPDESAVFARLVISDQDDEIRYPLEWGTRIVRPDSALGDPVAVNTLQILIIRSPVSGGITTYTTTSDVLPSAMAAGRLNEQIPICLDSAGWIKSTRSGVLLLPEATGGNGVKLATQQECVV